MTDWNTLTNPNNSVGPMSQLPAEQWPATNAPIAPGEVVAPPLPVEILNRLRDARLPQDRDGVLMLWQQTKERITELQADEMELRKLCVKQLAPAPKEGVNNVDLGGGYVAKATVKYNYNLKAPPGKKDVVEAVDDVIDRFTLLDNEGSFIAERLFKWKVEMSVAEYRKLVEEAATSATKAALLKELNTVLEIKEAAPTLEIKEPKAKK